MTVESYRLFQTTFLSLEAYHLGFRQHRTDFDKTTKEMRGLATVAEISEADTKLSQIFSSLNRLKNNIETCSSLLEAYPENKILSDLHATVVSREVEKIIEPKKLKKV